MLPAYFVVKKRSLANTIAITWKFISLAFWLMSALFVVGKMDLHKFNYSMKNIPIPANEHYELEFLHSIHSLSSRC